MTTGIKTSPTSDNIEGFHGALTAAASAKIAGSDKHRLVAPKQAQSSKSQTTDSKRKTADPSLYVSDNASPVVSSSRLVTQDAAPIQIALALPVNAEIPAQVASQTTDVLTESPSSEAGAPTSSPASISSVHPPKPQQQVAGGIGNETLNDQSNLYASNTQESATTPNISHSLVRVVAAPALQTAASKTSPPEQAIGDSQAADPSNAELAINPTDTPTLDAQSAFAVVPPSVTAPFSLASFNSARESDGTPKIDSGTIANGSSNADTLKRTVASQAAAATSKAKPASSLDVRGKVADDKDHEAQVASAPAPIASVAKVVEATGTFNQGMNQTQAAIADATLQPSPQSISSDGSNPIVQTMASLHTPAEPTAPAVQGQGASESQIAQSVTSAQLTQSMRSSEMKLGMQSAEFGNISISTSLNHQAISAQISIDHAELGRALAVHLPAIEEKLGSAYGVQAKVELRESNTFSASNNSEYSNSGQQSREQRQSDRGATTSLQGVMLQTIAAHSSLVSSTATAGGSRLDIRI